MMLPQYFKNQARKYMLGIINFFLNLRIDNTITQKT